MTGDAVDPRDRRSRRGSRRVRLFDRRFRGAFPRARLAKGTEVHDGAETPIRGRAVGREWTGCCLSPRLKDPSRRGAGAVTRSSTERLPGSPGDDYRLRAQVAIPRALAEYVKNHYRVTRPQGP